MNSTEIAAADALKFFKGQSIKVQTATRVKVKGDDGKTREQFETAKSALSEEHVLSAKDYGDRVTITTVDGQRHEAVKGVKSAAKE